MYNLFTLLFVSFFSACTPASEKNDPVAVTENGLSMLTVYDLGGMRDMDKDIASTFYLLKKEQVMKINELRTPTSKLLRSDTVTSNTVRFTNENPLGLIPGKYITGDAEKTFGLPNAADNGGWGITLFTTSGKENTLLFDNDDANIPADLKKIHQLFLNLKAGM